MARLCHGSLAFIQVVCMKNNGEERIDMSLNMMFSIFGLVGGLLCCVGDILFDFKGRGNKKLGTSGNIDSNWMKMSYWRFGASILFAMAGDILAGLGIFSLAEQIKEHNLTLAVIMAVCGYVGVIGGFFVHSVLCIQPIIYKKIMEEDNFNLADRTLEAFYKAVIPPFFIAYIVLMVPSICSVIAILAGYLAVPKWFVLLNSIVFMMVGIILRKVKNDWFYDLPGIIMPSLGLGMLGLIGIVNLM